MDNEEAQVGVPSAAFRATPEQTEVMNRTRRLFEEARQQIGDDMAISVMLSCITREIRHLYGVETARHILNGFAKTMQEAAKHDLPR